MGHFGGKRDGHTGVAVELIFWHLCGDQASLYACA